MLIWDKASYRIITAVEGTGDNLLDEDIKQGYKDYMMTSVYVQDGDELKLEDGGQMMSEKLIADMDTEEILKRVGDFWGMETDEFVILED